jgi:Holliday junction resolvase RusA-like endonuclease
MVDLSDFPTIQIVGVCIAGGVYNHNGQFVRCVQSSSFQGYNGIHKSWEPELSERYRHALKRIVSTNHRTTAADVTVELSVHLEDPVSTKAVDENFTNPISMIKLQLLNL